LLDDEDRAPSERVTIHRSTPVLRRAAYSPTPRHIGSAHGKLVNPVTVRCSALRHLDPQIYARFTLTRVRTHPRRPVDCRRRGTAKSACAPIERFVLYAALRSMRAQEHADEHVHS